MSHKKLLVGLCDVSEAGIVNAKYDKFIKSCSATKNIEMLK